MKDKTPKHVVATTLNNVSYSQAWDPKVDGEPTDENAQKWRESMNKSLVKGGNNYHLTQAAGVIVQCGTAQVIDNNTRQVVAIARQPMFEVIPSND